MTSYIVSAPGNSTRAGTNALVSFDVQGAVIKASSIGAVTVYLGANGPSATSAKIKTLKVNCQAESSGVMTSKLWLYYGKTKVIDGDSVNDTSDFDFPLSTTEQIVVNAGSGINIALELEFSSTNATFHIYSIDITFD